MVVAWGFMEKKPLAPAALRADSESGETAVQEAAEVVHYMAVVVGQGDLYKSPATRVPVAAVLLIVLEAMVVMGRSVLYGPDALVHSQQLV